MGKKPARPKNRASSTAGGGARRRPYAFATQLLLGVVALGALAVGVLLSVNGEGPPEPRILDELTYQRVEQLRQTMAVTNDDLAAMGLNAEQAAVVIQSVLDWADQHSERLATANRGVRQAESDLRRSRRAMQSGDASLADDLPGYANLSTAVEEAVTARESVLSELGTVLATPLQEVSDDWTAAKLNAGRIRPSISGEDLEGALSRATALRAARQGDEAGTTPSSLVQRYRDGLAGTPAIIRAAQQIYVPDVVVDLALTDGDTALP